MNASSPQWKEIYAGGSREAERQMFDGFAKDIRAIQRRVAAKTARKGMRTLHAKILVGIQNAQLHIAKEIPERFAAGNFRPGATFPVAIRLSNAAPVCLGDVGADMRGVALRIGVGNGACHDLLMTSYPVSHARDARQFIEVAKIATGPKALILPRLLLKLGFAETRRLTANIKAASRPVESLASLRFWSRAPLLWGDAGPVRYTLRPLAPAVAKKPNSSDPDYLGTEFGERLRQGDILYRLALQPFVDEARTPIEDGAIGWREQDSPFIDVATLVIPQHDLSTAAARTVKSTIDGLAFNPWNCPPPFRPLGNLNRARGPVYAASAEEWLGSPAPRPNLPHTASVDPPTVAPASSLGNK